jgi:BASS family bile acid:Na+ symporter
MKQFIKSWALPLAIILGITGYFVSKIIVPDSLKPIFLNTASSLQPILIGAMLFVSFCKIKHRSIHFCKWHFIALLLQISLCFILAFMALLFNAEGNTLILFESAILCFLFPTATAAVVVASKLGSPTENLVAYTMTIHIVTAIIAPVISWMLHHQINYHLTDTLYFIFIKTLPLIVLPLIIAALAKKLIPECITKLNKQKNLAFYLWAIALTFAMAFSVRSLMHTDITMTSFAALALISFVACVFQFLIGRHIGHLHQDSICASQALGQKNTVFGIWLAYTFFNPITAVVGGLYSIWHNLYNSWQLYVKCNKNV